MKCSNFHVAPNCVAPTEATPTLWEPFLSDLEALYGDMSAMGVTQISVDSLNFPFHSLLQLYTIIVDRSAIWDHIDFLGSPLSAFRRCFGNNGSQDGLLDGRRFQRYATQRLHCTMSGALRSTARGTSTPRPALITK